MGEIDDILNGLEEDPFSDEPTVDDMMEAEQLNKEFEEFKRERDLDPNLTSDEVVTL
jgi:hypothetical protein